MPKITFVGAGSVVFAKKLLEDVFSYPSLKDSEIYLMDIDPHRLSIIDKVAKNLKEILGYKTVINSSTDLEEALKGANYVINMIQVGGLEAYNLDIEIPKKYGINQAVGDTLGPGGVFRALRTIPELITILKKMEKLCPDALFINYTNPMAINCWAMNEISNIKNVGLCHSVQNTAKDISSYLKVPLEEVYYRTAGINHQAWFLEYKWKGKNLYPLLKEKYNDPEVYIRDVTKFEILKYFGYFVTESSIHMSEYVPYFRKNEYWIKKIHEYERKSTDKIQKDRDLRWSTNDEAGVYLKICKELAKNFDKDMEELLGTKEMNISASDEYGIQIINSMETNQSIVIHGNVKNQNLITNLPVDACVEVPCLVNKNGIQPTIIGDLPPQLAAINRTNINVQELAVIGALKGDKNAIHQAIMMDPLTSALLTLPEIESMTNELFEKESKYLCQFSE